MFGTMMSRASASLLSASIRMIPSAVSRAQADTAFCPIEYNWSNTLAS